VSHSKDSNREQGDDERKPKLKAIVEVIDGELVIYPIAQTDTECQDILDILDVFYRQERVQ
jgi:hypothetical protein